MEWASNHQSLNAKKYPRAADVQVWSQPKSSYLYIYIEAGDPYQSDICRCKLKTLPIVYGATPLTAQRHLNMNIEVIE